MLNFVCARLLMKLNTIYTAILNSRSESKSRSSRKHQDHITLSLYRNGSGFSARPFAPPPPTPGDGRNIATKKMFGKKGVDLRHPRFEEAKQPIEHNVIRRHQKIESSRPDNHTRKHPATYSIHHNPNICIYHISRARLHRYQ